MLWLMSLLGGSVSRSRSRSGSRRGLKMRLTAIRYPQLLGRKEEPDRQPKNGEARARRR